MHGPCTARLCAVAAVHDILVAHVAARVRREVRVLTEAAEQPRRAARRAVAAVHGLRQREQRVACVAVRREDGVEGAWGMRASKLRGAHVRAPCSVRAACVRRARQVCVRASLQGGMRGGGSSCQGAVGRGATAGAGASRRCAEVPRGRPPCDGAASGLEAASERGRGRASFNQRSCHPAGPRQSCARAPRRLSRAGTRSKPATLPVTVQAPARPQELPLPQTHRMARRGATAAQNAAPSLASYLSVRRR